MRPTSNSRLCRRRNLGDRSLNAHQPVQEPRATRAAALGTMQRFPPLGGRPPTMSATSIFATFLASDTIGVAVLPRLAEPHHRRRVISRRSASQDHTLQAVLSVGIALFGRVPIQ
jgi:hypothetical protein